MTNDTPPEVAPVAELLDAALALVRGDGDRDWSALAPLVAAMSSEIRSGADDDPAPRRYPAPPGVNRVDIASTDHADLAISPLRVDGPDHVARILRIRVPGLATPAEARYAATAVIKAVGFLHGWAFPGLATQPRQLEAVTARRLARGGNNLPRRGTRDTIGGVLRPDLVDVALAVLSTVAAHPGSPALVVRPLRTAVCRAVVDLGPPPGTDPAPMVGPLAGACVSALAQWEDWRADRRALVAGDTDVEMGLVPGRESSQLRAALVAAVAPSLPWSTR